MRLSPCSSDVYSFLVDILSVIPFTANYMRGRYHPKSQGCRLEGRPAAPGCHHHHQAAKAACQGGFVPEADRTPPRRCCGPRAMPAHRHRRPPRRGRWSAAASARDRASRVASGCRRRPGRGSRPGARRAGPRTARGTRWGSPRTAAAHPWQGRAHARRPHTRPRGRRAPGTRAPTLQRV